LKKNCLNCGKEIDVKPSHFERKKYCSRTCKTEYQKNHPPEFWELLSRKKEVLCNYCGKTLKRKPSAIFTTNFCNRKCKKKYQLKNGERINQHLINRVTKTCKFCGSEYIVPKNRESTSNYCSKHCLGKSNGARGKIQYKKRVKVCCNTCHKEIEKKPSTLRNLNFCSIECMSKYYSDSMMFSGENSPTWAGGDIDYYGPNWHSRRKHARERDNYTCQDCGKTEKEYGSKLSVHHIIPFRSFNGDWEEANKLSNLITLCEYPCHRKRHSRNKHS
jgi:uncharacterized Zn-finger protein